MPGARSAYGGRRMKQKLLYAFSVLSGIFLVIGVILNCVNFFCFYRPFYEREYEKLATAQRMGMSQEDLEKATEALLDYLKGERQDLLVQGVVHGQERQIFNEREIAHMADVKNLYLWAMRIGNCALAVSVLFYLTAWFSHQDKKSILSGYISGNWILFGLIAVLGIYAALDFNNFWTNFHHVFFTNDLWLLDPREDLLIQMVPEQFFFDLVMRIVIVSAMVLAVLMFLAYWMRKRYKKAGNPA